MIVKNPCRPAPTTTTSARDDRPQSVEEMLREIAYVLHTTRRLTRPADGAVPPVPAPRREI